MRFHSHAQTLLRVAALGAVVLLSACQSASTMPSVGATSRSQPAFGPLVKCHPTLWVKPEIAKAKPRQRVALQAILLYRGRAFVGCIVIGTKTVLAKWTTNGGHLLNHPSQLLVDFWARKLASYQIVATYHSRSASAVVTLIGNCPSLPRGTGLLPDGDFSQEWGATVEGIGPGRTLGPHWTSGGPQTIDFIGYGDGPWHAPKGVCSVDLDGTPGPGSIVHDTVPTKVNQSYTLKFHFSGNGACGSMVQTMVVQAGSQSATYTWDTAHHNDAQHGKWLQETFTFNAVGTSVTPSFTSADPSGGNCGPVVAAITMSQN